MACASMNTIDKHICCYYTCYECALDTCSWLVSHVFCTNATNSPIFWPHISYILIIQCSNWPNLNWSFTLNNCYFENKWANRWNTHTHALVQMNRMKLHNIPLEIGDCSPNINETPWKMTSNDRNAITIFKSFLKRRHRGTRNIEKGKPSAREC